MVFVLLPLLMSSMRKGYIVEGAKATGKVPKYV